jgi:hypothetical protein
MGRRRETRVCEAGNTYSRTMRQPHKPTSQRPRLELRGDQDARRWRRIANRECVTANYCQPLRQKVSRASAGICCAAFCLNGSAILAVTRFFRGVGTVGEIQGSTRRLDAVHGPTDRLFVIRPRSGTHLEQFAVHFSREFVDFRQWLRLGADACTPNGRNVIRARCQTNRQV